MKGSRRREGKGGVTVDAKECVEWNASTDHYHATAPASMRSLMAWQNNPLYEHLARPSSEEEVAATTRELDIDSGKKSCVRDIGSACDHHAVARSGRGWTIAVCALMGCRDVDDVRVSLGLTAEVVLSIPSSELQKAAKEFDAVIQGKRAALPCIFIPSGGYTIPFNADSVADDRRMYMKLLSPPARTLCVGSSCGTAVCSKQGPP